MIIASKIVKRVATIDENKTVFDAVQLMTEEFIGSVVLTNASGICGLFTERELMMNVVAKGKDPQKALIKDKRSSSSFKNTSPLEMGDDGKQANKRARCCEADCGGYPVCCQTRRSSLVIHPKRRWITMNDGWNSQTQGGSISNPADFTPTRIMKTDRSCKVGSINAWRRF
jgi:CBS domain-containing protein